MTASFVRAARFLTKRSRTTPRLSTEDQLVLVSTDATAEGLNLHSRCFNLVHVELPYNPNRLELRNGPLPPAALLGAPHEGYPQAMLRPPPTIATAPRRSVSTAWHLRHRWEGRSCSCGHDRLLVRCGVMRNAPSFLLSDRLRGAIQGKPYRPIALCQLEPAPMALDRPRLERPTQANQNLVCRLALS